MSKKTNKKYLNRRKETQIQEKIGVINWGSGLVAMTTA